MYVFFSPPASHLACVRKRNVTLFLPQTRVSHALSHMPSLYVHTHPHQASPSVYCYSRESQRDLGRQALRIER